MFNITNVNKVLRALSTEPDYKVIHLNLSHNEIVIQYTSTSVDKKLAKRLIDIVDNSMSIKILPMRGVVDGR